MHGLSEKCVDIKHTYCDHLNSCLLDSEAGLLLVRSVELPLYINKCFCKQCMVLKCMKNGVKPKWSCNEAKSIQILTYCVVVNVYVCGRCVGMSFLDNVHHIQCICYKENP